MGEVSRVGKAGKREDNKEQTIMSQEVMRSKYHLAWPMHKMEKARR